MGQLSVWDQVRVTGLSSEQQELIDWSVLSAGNKMSEKILGKRFPHPSLEAIATYLALFKIQPKLATQLLKKRSRLPVHLFMRTDPQKRILMALVQEHKLQMTYKECKCEYPLRGKLLCRHCGGIMKEKD